MNLHPLTKRKFRTESCVTDCNLWDRARPLFDAKHIEQFRMNVYYYAELLFRWQMYSKRLELLKAVTKQDISLSPKGEPYTIGLFFEFEDTSGSNFWFLGLHRICTRIGCQSLLPTKASTCQYCSTPCTMPLCTICRLPTKGTFYLIVYLTI